MGDHPLCSAFSWQGLSSIKIIYNHYQQWLAPQLASAFNRLSQKASSPSITRTYCYAGLAVSSIAMAVTIAVPASTHCAYPLKDGQAELAWVTGWTPKWYTYKQSPISRHQYLNCGRECEWKPGSYGQLSVQRFYQQLKSQSAQHGLSVV